MRPDCPAASVPFPLSRSWWRGLNALALSLLPFNFAMANIGPQATDGTGWAIDVKTMVLLVLTVAAAWLLRIVLRRYGESADKLKNSKRQRLQPNL